jgi:neurofibromin 1
MLSSTVFLRFINPALVAPQHFGLLVQGEIPPSGQRGMKLMSKILQNLANHLPFKKEGHMMTFNWYLEDNFDKTRKYVANDQHNCLS